MDMEAVGVAGASAGQVDLRLHSRVTGPFEGVRRGLLDVDVQIYDLSEGGCFVTSVHEQPCGVEIELEIELPDGTITVKGETRHGRAGFGFGVRFVNLAEEELKRLEQALNKLRRHRTTTH
jgi:hypothetical protein